MGPIDRREREKLEAKRRILDVARELFAENGYEAVAIRAIAERVEYSPRTIYLHFKDKDDLIRQLCAEDFRTFGEGMAMLARVADPLERLRAIGLAYAQFAWEHPHHYKLMFLTQPPPKPEGCEEDPHKGNPEADAYALLRLCVADAIQQRAFHPQHTDPDLLAQVFWSALHGVVALEITHRCHRWVPWVPIQVRVETTIDMLIRGIRA